MSPPEQLIDLARYPIVDPRAVEFVELAARCRAQLDETGCCILPGFLEGFQNISRDEHRHVAYGTWYLKQKCQDPAIAARVQDKLVELLPVAAGVFVPPGMQLGDSYEILGYSSDDVNEFAFTALSRRLKVIGVELPAVAAA